MKSFSASLFLLALVIFSAIEEGSSRKPGRGKGRPGRGKGRPGKGKGKPGRPNPSNECTPDELWKQVEEIVPEAPCEALTVDWPYVRAELNDTTSVGLIMDRPELEWKTEEDALYTVMIVDGGIQRVLPDVYFHWLVTNIPGNAVELGNEVMQYVPPFSFEFTEDGNFITDKGLSAHPMLLLVFKQMDGRVAVDKPQAGCNPEIANRVFSYTNLAAKFGLELVAGNFIQVPYSGIYTKQMLCRFTKCTRTAFPFPIPGVNDLPDCQPRQDIMDITVKGPQLERLDDYGKYISVYSVESGLFAIQNTYPTGSTGKAIEYTAIEGAFNDAKFGEDNLDDTLEGIVDASVLSYPSLNATIDIFTGVYPEIFEALGPAMATYATENTFTIVHSQPDDQDFDFESILTKPGMVFDMNIVRVKEGQEALFEE